MLRFLIPEMPRVCCPSPKGPWQAIQAETSRVRSPLRYRSLPLGNNSLDGFIAGQFCFHLHHHLKSAARFALKLLGQHSKQRYQPYHHQFNPICEWDINGIFAGTFFFISLVNWFYQVWRMLACARLRECWYYAVTLLSPWQLTLSSRLFFYPLR